MLDGGILEPGPALGNGLTTLVRGRLAEFGLSYEPAADQAFGLISRASLHRLASGPQRGRLGDPHR